jgi:hypothetical protein
LLLIPCGCTSLTSPVSGVPAHRLPAQFLAPPKNNLIDIDISRLAQEKPRNYLVDVGDVLGIWIEGVVGGVLPVPLAQGMAPVRGDERPLIHQIPAGSDRPPPVGAPFEVREDGTISLPLLSKPLPVRGLTLHQIENVIRNAYAETKLLKFLPTIMVTRMKDRTYSVVVMRQDGIRQEQLTGNLTVERRTAGHAIELDAYKNDVMNALALTGGLPGLSAKNEVLIMRSNLMNSEKRDAFVREFYSQPVEACLCRPPLPDDPAIIRIPLRLPPGEVPTFTQDDIILNDGDIVYIQNRDREVFYTGGLLGGGEHPLPRDYDLDVLGAIAVVGKSVAGANLAGAPGNAGFGGGFGAGSVGGVPPGQLYILRKTPCNGQITIAVDLTRAIRDPSARPLVQPGDMLILQYKPEEEILNFGLGTFFTYGIFQILQNND